MSTSLGKKLARILTGILITLVVLFGIAISIGNSTPIALDFLSYRTFEAPVSIWLVAAFVAGMVSSAAILFGSFVKGRLANRSLDRALKRAQADSMESDES